MHRPYCTTKPKPELPQSNRASRVNCHNRNDVITIYTGVALLMQHPIQNECEVTTSCHQLLIYLVHYQPDNIAYQNEFYHHKSIPTLICHNFFFLLSASVTVRYFVDTNLSRFFTVPTVAQFLHYHNQIFYVSISFQFFKFQQ